MKISVQQQFNCWIKQVRKVLKHQFSLPLPYYFSNVAAIKMGRGWRELPIPQWLKVIEKYSLAVLKARSPKSMFWHGHTFSKAAKGEFFLDPSNSWWFHKLLSLRLHHSISVSWSPGLLLYSMSPLLSLSNLPLLFSYMMSTSHLWI